MKHTDWKPITLVAMVAVLAASATSGQSQERVRERAATRTTAVTQVRKLSTVMSYKVVIQDDQPAGQVVDFVLSDGGCIDYVVAQYEDQYYVVPYSAITVQYDSSVVFVDIAPAQFRQVQFFTTENWPDIYAASYRDRVFTTFKVQSIRSEGTTTFRRDLKGDRNREDADPADRPNRRKTDRTERLGKPGDPGDEPDPPGPSRPDLAPKPDVNEKQPLPASKLPEKPELKPAPRGEAKPQPKPVSPPKPEPAEKKPISEKPIKP